MLAQAALGLGLLGGEELTGGLASSLGIEDFQLGSEGSGNSTSVVASGNITERLSLRYGVGVFEPANTIALRYKLSRRVFTEAASGLASSLDIFYKRDFEPFTAFSKRVECLILQGVGRFALRGAQTVGPRAAVALRPAGLSSRDLPVGGYCRSGASSSRTCPPTDCAKDRQHFPV